MRKVRETWPTNKMKPVGSCCGEQEGLPQPDGEEMKHLLTVEETGQAHRQARLYPLLEPRSSAGPSGTGLFPSEVSNIPQDSLREEHDPEVPASPANNYLQVSDLNDRDQILKIERVVHHKFHGELKPVAEFREIGKGLILDTVNLDAIEDKYGVNPDDWIGECIQLYASEPERSVRIHPCCRGCEHWNGYMEGGYCGICYLKPGVSRRSQEHQQETSDNSHQQDTYDDHPIA